MNNLKGERPCSSNFHVKQIEVVLVIPCTLILECSQLLSYRKQHEGAIAIFAPALPFPTRPLGAMLRKSLKILGFVIIARQGRSPKTAKPHDTLRYVSQDEVRKADR